MCLIVSFEMERKQPQQEYRCSCSLARVLKRIKWVDVHEGSMRLKQSNIIKRYLHELLTETEKGEHVSGFPFWFASTQTSLPKARSCKRGVVSI